MLTFSQVTDRVVALSKHFAGLGPESCILLKGSDSPSGVIGLLAARLVGLPVVLVPQGLLPKDEKYLASIVGASALVDAQPGTCEPAILTMDFEPTKGLNGSICFVTSGSTGRGKVVLRSEESLLAEGRRYEKLLALDCNDQILSAAPISHAYGFGFAFASSLLVGCPLHLLQRFGPRTCLTQIATRPVTVLALVPVMAKLLCEINTSSSLKHNLRVAMAGAGPVPPWLDDEWVARLGLPLSRNYGSSETGATLAALPPHPVGATGRPMPEVEAAVAAPQGQAGQLWVRTQHLFSGYWEEHGFQPALLSPDGWFATGDIAVQESGGYFRITGRQGRMLRRGGQSINPVEIEDQIRTNPNVTDALVVGEPNELGENDIKAIVETRNGRVLRPAELHSFLATKLAPQKLPNRWVVTPKLSRNSAGKAQVPAPTENAGQWSINQCLSAYRLSEVFLASEDLGLMSLLSKGPKTAETLAVTLSLDVEATELVLNLLTTCGVLTRSRTGTFSLTNSSMWLASRPLVPFEKVLRRSWLTSETIADALRHGRSARLFARLPPEKEFFQLYASAMSSVYSKRVAYYLLHWTNPPRGARVLEIGYSLGSYSSALKAHDKTSCSILHNWERRVSGNDTDPGVNCAIGSWSQLPSQTGTFDIIAIQNGIHSLPPRDAPSIFKYLWSLLGEAGVLLISDVFVDLGEPADSWFPAVLVLDWLTHGDWHFRTTDDVVAVLKSNRFAHYAVHRLPYSVLQVIVSHKESTTT